MAAGMTINRNGEPRVKLEMSIEETLSLKVCLEKQTSYNLKNIYNVLKSLMS